MNIQTFIILNLAIYLPFHLFEEAVCNFPKWMYEHRWLPYHMTHGHWMANNLFIYYPIILVAAVLFLLDERFACCGIGVLVWGVINFGDHFYYTIRDKKVSPGLITGILFLVNSVAGLYCFFSSGAGSVLDFGIGILIGGVLFGLPIGLCVAVYPLFERFFNPT